MVWFCAQANPGKQTNAMNTLAHLGFETFSPVYKRQTACRHTVTSWLFPSYIFCRSERLDAWPSAMRAPGVKRLLLFLPDNLEYAVPHIVEDAVVESLRLGAVPSPDKAFNKQPVIPPGCYVHIKNGPLRDRTRKALVLWSDGERVRLLVDIFARGVTVEFRQTDVELAGEAT